MSTPYDDIINLPRHVSETHAQMSRADRAAQFSPFAALTGYDAEIVETGRLTDERIELTETEQEAIGARLNLINEQLSERPEVTITYFIPDSKKSGGKYENLTGAVKKIDPLERLVVMHGGKKISIDDITQINGELFREMDTF